MAETSDEMFNTMLDRLAGYEREHTKMAHRMRNSAIVLMMVIALALVDLAYTAISSQSRSADNQARIADIQHTRRTAIFYACHQQNRAHARSIIFLDETELTKLHTRPLLRTLPTIEAQTIRAIKRLPAGKQRATLANHRLLEEFIDTLAPHENCTAQARRTLHP